MENPYINTIGFMGTHEESLRYKFKLKNMKWAWLKLYHQIFRMPYAPKGYKEKTGKEVLFSFIYYYSIYMKAEYGLNLDELPYYWLQKYNLMMIFYSKKKNFRIGVYN